MMDLKQDICNLLIMLRYKRAEEPEKNNSSLTWRKYINVLPV